MKEEDIILKKKHLGILAICVGSIVFFLIIAMVIFSIIKNHISAYEGWKTIVIEDCGSMMIPGDWEYTVEDDISYIFDEEGQPVMIEWQTGQQTISNKYYDNYIYMNTITSAVLSNSVIYGKQRMWHEDEEKELMYMKLAGDDELEFIVWDTSLSSKELKKIANTFDGTYEE